MFGDSASPRVALPPRRGAARGRGSARSWGDLDERRRVLLIPRRKHPRASRDKELPLLPNHRTCLLKKLRLIRSLGRLRREEGTTVGPCRSSRARSELHAPGLLTRRINDIRLHDLRHDAITSHVREKQLSLPRVMLISGHDDVHLLIRYTHLTADDVKLPRQVGCLAFLKIRTRWPIVTTLSTVASLPEAPSTDRGALLLFLELAEVIQKRAPLVMDLLNHPFFRS